MCMTTSVPGASFSHWVTVYPSAPSDCHIQASSLPQAREMTVTWSATMKAE